MNKNFIRQAQELQARMARVQQELEEATVEGTAGGGVIKITMTGHQKVLQVTISPEALEGGDVEMLQDLVLAAINDASEKAQQMASSRMGAITGGMKIPGLM
ncbi:MAG: YbaB/EbfC family nucleoid-associated protein [Dehalococcoidia bacterium]|nr:YbaB/EbfC family nucleoid-associated protein [Dehalococcoidia bacterium]MDZ4247612.1 YbaB/EbfC family nucleoid-associated protein [Dehalococcoidia bacterium]